MSATVSQPAAAGDEAGSARSGTGGAIEQAGEQRSRRLESLRALGWIAVALTHVLLLALAGHQGFGDSYKNRLIYGSGFLALFLFFAMSGYLLYLPFARRHLAGGRKIDVGRYARNRMLRILPLYCIVVAFLLIVHPLGAARGDWWRWLTFTENFDVNTIHRLNAPLWSVAVEVQFYAALPLLAWIIGKLGGRSFLRTVGILLGLAIASWIIRSREVVHTDHVNYLGILGKYAMPSFLYAFIGGMLLAVARISWDRRPPAWSAWPIVGASGAWIAAGVALHLLTATDVALYEPTTAFVALLIVGGCVLPLRGGKLVSTLEWRPLAALGVASFSLYLWHWPILELISGVRIDAAPQEAVRIVGEPTDFKRLILIGMPLCAVAGLASYWLIERPFLSQRRGWGATGTTPTKDADADADARKDDKQQR